MPIIISKSTAFITSRAKFVIEYLKIENEIKTKNKEFEKPALDQVVDSITNGFDINISARALLNCYNGSKQKEKSNDLEKTSSFNFIARDAQELIIELLVLFSKFYQKFDVLDGNDKLMTIDDYILPYKKYYFQETNFIQIKNGKLYNCFFINDIKQIKGLLNNFVVFFDKQLIHFCSDAHLGHFIKAIPYDYETSKGEYSALSDFDYIFDRNRPSRFKLNRKRKKGLLILIQFKIKQ